MSKSASQRPMTVPDFVAAKQAGHKLSVLTAYDCLFARLFDTAGIDAILVGDSMGMVVQGHDTTLPVTLDQIIYHTEIVARSVQRALVIADLPFMSYQVGPRQAVKNAGRVLKETGAACVKLEGGQHQARTIESLTAVDLPVMAHVGMRPQSVRKLGRMSAVQRDTDALLADARSAQEAGAFAIVLELIPSEAAQQITAELSIPTIGIGAGPHCDGQVLVAPDMLGLTGFEPKFLKKYADLGQATTKAVKQFVSDVQSGQYPDESHAHH
ncbi:MAG: 3-methyl-2-oxobutanoate hydroxymethyltransferase [Planctomycetaceae bacterium]